MAAVHAESSPRADTSTRVDGRTALHLGLAERERQATVQIAAGLGLIVTRYVDNIDFSGVRSREAILPTIAALQAAGLSVRHKKVMNAGSRRAHVVTGNLVDGRHLRLPRQKRANVRTAVHEIIQRYEEGLPISTKAMNRLRGRLQHLRTQGHPRDAQRLMVELEAAGTFNARELRR